MRIVFNLVKCGLGNNGGSLTVVRSANALVDLGHEVFIIDSMKNQHTWTPLKAKHIIPKRNGILPRSDVVIATGYETVPSSLMYPASLRVHWLRAWETWKMSEPEIVGRVLQVPLIKIVNSSGLQKKLEKYNVKSFIIRPGNDLDECFPMNIRSHSEIVIGGLYHRKHRTKRDFWVVQTSSYLKKKYRNVKLYMLGIYHNPHYNEIDRYFREPEESKKNIFYNKVSIWLSPSTNEGLHIVPQETMLTECPVVTTDAPLAGTEDYIQHGKTGLVSKNDFASFVKETERLVKDLELRFKLGKAGREKIEELGDRKQNMKEMIELFEGFLK